MTESEEALRQHHDFWVQHVEATLGPIRDESQRLWDALKEEVGARQLQDQQRVAWFRALLPCCRGVSKGFSPLFTCFSRGESTKEKLLQDEVHALYLLLDEEKFEREQQLMSYERWCDASQQQVAKSQYHLEKEASESLGALRALS